jgi:hypothetical protein
LPSFLALLNFRRRFPYEVVCFLLRNFLTRFPNLVSCSLAVVRSPYEICCVLLRTFLMQFPQEISCFLAVMRLRMFEDDVMSPEHALVIQGGSLGVRVGGVMYVI